MQDKIKRIYGCLSDEISRLIFEKRLLFSFTGEEKYILQMLELLPEKRKADVLMERAYNCRGRLIAYGAGNDLRLLMHLYPGVSFLCLCDGNPLKQGKMVNGYRVISPEELLEKYADIPILITSTGFQKEIHCFLRDNGIDEEQIINVGAVTAGLYERQYFEKGIIDPEAGEIFVDGGCYDCSTAKLFCKWCDGDYKGIYAFEPDPDNYKLCSRKGQDIAGLKLINKGLWNCETELRFTANAGQGSNIDEKASDVIKVTSIDSVLDGSEATFIKLDVEGAEFEALKGAQYTIRKYHPKLAISVYHKTDDIWTIPDYILSLCEDYHLFVRHYQLSRNETILYAV